MRISDWTADVCSSDLAGARYGLELGLRVRDAGRVVAVPPCVLDLLRKIRRRPWRVYFGFVPMLEHQFKRHRFRKPVVDRAGGDAVGDRKSTRLNSSH